MFIWQEHYSQPTAMVQFLMNERNVAAYEDSNYSLILIEKARSSMKPEHAPFIMY